MGRRITGLVFIAIAAFLFSVRYLAAAIYGAGVTVNNQLSGETFKLSLSHIGEPVRILSIISLVIGVIYLAWAELKENK